MDSTEAAVKPHAVCVPFPLQGHINAMLNLAKVLHYKGIHITFVNTEYNHRRILKSRGPASLEGLPDFHFKIISDGLPLPEDVEAPQDLFALCPSTQTNCSEPLRCLIAKLNQPATGVPPVTCIVSDGIMSFTLEVAAEFGIPGVLFWTLSACGTMAFLQFKELVERGLVPLKNESDLTNGYLDTPVNWIPGMKTLRLRDLPSLIKTTAPAPFLDFANYEAQRATKATAIILNTYDDLEGPVIEALSTMLPPVYTVGPLLLLFPETPGSPLTSIGANLWKEDAGCLEWLGGREAGSVLYVNFGSLAVMSNEQLIEFAWGLANSERDFLWVIRPDLVTGDSSVLPEEFALKSRGRSLLVRWCAQVEVLSHPAVGGFLTHSGWNSTTESICAGVPMLCWGLFAEQPTNCWYACNEWGIGMEVVFNARRKEVEALVRELMGGEKGRVMKEKVLEQKKRAIKATQQGGSSSLNLNKLVNQVLLANRIA